MELKTYGDSTRTHKLWIGDYWRCFWWSLQARSSSTEIRSQQLLWIIRRIELPYVRPESFKFISINTGSFSGMLMQIIGMYMTVTRSEESSITVS